MGPAKADGGASTRNIILGIGALGAAGAIGSNILHKKAAAPHANSQAQAVIGYTPDGTAVYGDGSVTMPNGHSYHPTDYGQTVACNSGNCTITGGDSDAPYNSAQNSTKGNNGPTSTSNAGAPTNNGNGPPSNNNAPSSSNNAPNSNSGGSSPNVIPAVIGPTSTT
jgi:hypothetical protein